MTDGEKLDAPRDDLWSSVAPLLPALWLPLCGFFVLAFLYAVSSRFAYPFPLEWLEPDTPDIAARILAGLPLYCEPSYAYVPSMKTPLYYYVVAGFSAFSSNGLLAGRAVSILSTVGVCALIWHFIRREGGSRLWAAFGVGLFLATYHIARDWYDIARLDSFYLLLLLLAAFLLRFAAGRRGAVAAGLIFAVAFFTKQATLMLMIPSLLLYGFAARGRVIMASLAAAIAIMGGMVAMHITSDGWSTFFLVEVPRYVMFDPDGAADFWPVDIGVPLAPAVSVSAIWILCRWRTDRDTALFYAGLLGGALLIGWAGRANIAGATNVLMPAYASLAIAMPLALAAAWRAWSRRGALGAAGAIGVHIAALLQLAILFYDPRQAIPSASDKALSEAILARLQGVDGGIFIMDDRYFATLLGGKSVGLDYSSIDLANDRTGPVTARFRASIIDALRAGRFAGIVDPPDFVRSEIALGPPLSLNLSSKPRDRRNNFTPRMQAYYPIAK